MRKRRPWQATTSRVKPSPIGCMEYARSNFPDQVKNTSTPSANYWMIPRRDWTTDRLIQPDVEAGSGTVIGKSYRRLGAVRPRRATTKDRPSNCAPMFGDRR